MSAPDLPPRFAGAMLGTFIGDVFGMPFEGSMPQEVSLHLSLGAEESLARMRRSTYTDDTQMMIGVAETLDACGGFDGAHMADRFVSNFDPARGYGSSATAVIKAISQGLPSTEAATIVFSDGSFGNGAAMRVAPVGLLYHEKHDELRRIAESQASITHTHPLGMEGAVLQAFAVAKAVKCDPGGFGPSEFLTSVRRFVRPDCEEFADKLRAVHNLLAGDPTIDEVVAQLGHDIRAHYSVPAALYAFLSHASSFEEAVTYAISLGGDADTIGAMTGAIASAFHGLEGIPEDWLAAIEHLADDREYVLMLATRLFAGCVERMG